MSIRLHNDLTRRKEEFVPLEPGKVLFYNCGPTVYGLFHIGNARTFVIFDTLRRYLKYRGYDVRYVQNFTDVDDKIINRAREMGIGERELADQMIAEYFKDADALGLDRADAHPRVTDHIAEIIAHIRDLVEKGYAYEIPGDGVYYRVQHKDDYGKLSGRSLDDLLAGARVEVDERKEHPADFALWKARVSNEIAWDSPWGPGRPGWHIECSVMARMYLGDTIDIHSGGEDLIFPHHENEIAQSEPVTGKIFARYWLHGAFLNLSGEKMSKSLGNIITARDAIQRFGGELVRFYLLSAHYRRQLDFSEETVQAAKAGLDRLNNTANSLRHLAKVAERADLSASESELLAELQAYRRRFTDALDDDFNTALGQAVIFDLARELNTKVQAGASRELAEGALSLLQELGQVMGILRPEEAAGDPEAEALAQRWGEARKAKNWPEADRIREEARALGIMLENTPAGVRWRRT